MQIGETQCFEVAGIDRKHWSSTSPIRAIFRDAFEQVGLNNFNPHSFRDTLVQLGETVCQTPEQFKAWSQNLGHEGVMTTFMSYGSVGVSRQKEVIQNLGNPDKAFSAGADEIAEAIMRKLHQSNASVHVS